MRPLTDADCLELWARCEGLHPTSRASQLLAAAHPELDGGAISELSLGSRDAALLELYGASFGAMLAGLSECPACAATVELRLPVADLIVAPFDPTPPALRTVQVDGHEIVLRPVTTGDLLVAARAPDLETARAALVVRAVRSASLHGVDVPPYALPETVVHELAARLAEADPQAELLLELRCVECDATWSTLLDIGEFLWREVRRVAEQLTWEVHQLARAYSWSEEVVLRLPRHRRRRYLELVGA